jgi:hypothetical protein
MTQAPSLESTRVWEELFQNYCLLTVLRCREWYAYFLYLVNVISLSNETPEAPLMIRIDATANACFPQKLPSHTTKN